MLLMLPQHYFPRVVVKLQVSNGLADQIAWQDDGGKLLLSCFARFNHSIILYCYCPKQGARNMLSARHLVRQEYLTTVTK